MFVCSLMVVIKVYKGDLYNIYYEQFSVFLTNIFWAFKSVLECKHGYLIFNSKVQHLTFEVNGQHIWAMHQDLETLMPTFIFKDVFVVVKSLVNIQMQR